MSRGAKISKNMPKRKKFQLEYLVGSSPSTLYNKITTPNGLTEWFSDDVDVNQKTYTFKWDDTTAEAELIKTQPNKYVKFRWKEAPEDEYFEIEIKPDELTHDTALIITDFADEGDVVSATQLWDAQISTLKSALGL